MMKYHFFPAPATTSSSGLLHAQKKWSRNMHLLPKGVEVHWSGEARARPRDANFLRGAGGCLADLFSVCLYVCVSVTGQPLKNHDFWKSAPSFLPFREVERSKSANEHVSEKILCSSVSKTPSIYTADRF